MAHSPILTFSRSLSANLNLEDILLSSTRSLGHSGIYYSMPWRGIFINVSSKEATYEVIEKE